jgi:hypothetical protein
MKECMDSNIDLNDDEYKAILWACEKGIQDLLNEGFPQPGRSNAEILRGAAIKIEIMRDTKK